MFGKNVRRIVRKRFLYSHEYHDQKMGGIKRAKQFSGNTRIVRAKNVEEKIVGKKCEIRFFIYTQTSLPKNGGGETRETIFPETQELCEQKKMGKNRRKKCEKRFFIFTPIS